MSQSAETSCRHYVRAFCGHTGRHVRCTPITQFIVLINAGCSIAARSYSLALPRRVAVAVEVALLNFMKPHTPENFTDRHAKCFCIFS